MMERICLPSWPPTVKTVGYYQGGGVRGTTSRGDRRE